jgi:hypothetical protein
LIAARCRTRVARRRPATGIPFTEEHVRRLLDREPLAGPAAALLSLAWAHRSDLI